jgi:hypothetical protein
LPLVLALKFVLEHILDVPEQGSLLLPPERLLCRNYGVLIHFKQLVRLMLKPWLRIDFWLA